MHHKYQVIKWENKLDYRDENIDGYIILCT
jgi:hypothetical protein